MRLLTLDGVFAQYNDMAEVNEKSVQKEADLSMSGQKKAMFKRWLSRVKVNWLE